MFTLFGHGFVSVLECYAYAHLILTALLLFFELMFIVFSSFSFTSIIVVVVNIIIAAGSWKLVKALKQFVHTRQLMWELSRKIQDEDMQIIGRLLIYFIGFLPKFLVMFLGYEFYYFWSMISLCMVIIQIIYSEFLYEPGYNEVFYLHRCKPTFVGFVVHFILMITLSRIGVEYQETKDMIAVIACQLVFFPVCFLSYYDQCHVLKRRSINNFEPDGEGEQEYIDMRFHDMVQAAVRDGPDFEIEVDFRPINPVNPEEPYDPEKRVTLEEIFNTALTEEVAKPRVECKVCLFAYSYERIPRILKKCGHTLCEECAINLARQHENMFIKCPWCQEITAAIDGVNNLSKNYTVIDIVEGFQ